MFPKFASTHSDFFSGMPFVKVQTYMDFDKRYYLVDLSYDINEYSESMFMLFGIDMPAAIQKSVRKRQAEFLAGRIAASIGLSSIGRDKTQVTIGKDRQPTWPQGIVGSISHANDRALCILSSNTQNVVGIDVEEFQSQELVSAIGGHVLSDEECLKCDHYGLGDYLVVLIFSAKESIFKAYYPFVRTYFGFEIANFTSLDVRRNVLHFELNDNFARHYNLPNFVEVQYVISDKYCVTVVLEQR
ncbi:4'-phosphopantetheinyl transferase family protein [Vibrio sp. TRT 17S01]|uniref:4'-phosphopantetheinyl transferase family protein n=1 Tax=Vibrio sp. TRT 17S01 TaxID=3418505 RepID=UPI003CE9E31B